VPGQAAPPTHRRRPLHRRSTSTAINPNNHPRLSRNPWLQQTLWRAYFGYNNLKLWDLRWGGHMFVLDLTGKAAR
jgi:hypothetical protein